LKNYILGSQAHPNIVVGDFVVVEADRGEDIGVVVEVLPMKTFVERRIYMKTSVEDDNVIGRILRLASVAERQFLPEKFHDEESIVQVFASFHSLLLFSLPRP
jgi:putative ribosome biogenesis GTPase RsgA